MPNLWCLLPDHCIAVGVWMPHPCGGYYVHEAWCYGPHGRIGYSLDYPDRLYDHPNAR